MHPSYVTLSDTIQASPDHRTHSLIEADNKVFLNEELMLNHFNLIGNVDVVYIDPPYNTGNTKATNFTYNDSFGESKEWLTFMEDRLLPVKQLLKPTGVIIVSIDDSEVHHLRVLMDNIFGSRNFIAQIVVDGGNPKNNARLLSVTHEYMLVYANNMTALLKSGVRWRKKRDGIDLLLKEYAAAQKQFGDDYAGMSTHLKAWVKTAPLSKRLKVFYNADSRGLYTYADLSAPGNGARYDVLHPVTGKPCQVPSRGWGMTQEKMAKLLADDMVLFGADETAQPMRKLYLRNIKDQVQKAILDYPSRSSTHLLEKLLGRRSSFNNPKNLQMMEDLLDLVTPADGLVLDFFAGSGTTGHAVINLNAKLGSARRFVLVTNNENSIFDDVTLPRLQRSLELAKSKDGLEVWK